MRTRFLLTCASLALAAIAAAVLMIVAAWEAISLGSDSHRDA